MYDVRLTIDVRSTKYDVHVRPTTYDGRHGTFGIRHEIYDLYDVHTIRHTTYESYNVRRTTTTYNMYNVYVRPTTYERYDVRHVRRRYGIRRTTKPVGPLFVVDQYNFI